MALSVAYPPLALPSESTFSMLPSGTLPTVSCGFEPVNSPAKTEPLSPKDTGSPPSFLHSPLNSLSSNNFSHFKLGNTELYPRGSQGGELSSWTQKHPQRWEAQEVLDWVFSLTQHTGVDGDLLRGEAYNQLTGRQLCNMSLDDFLALDQRHGQHVHHVLNFLLEDTQFRQPLPPESFQSECFYTNLPHFDFLPAPDDVTPPQQQPPAPGDLRTDTMYTDLPSAEMKVCLEGLGFYDIDVDFTHLTGGKDSTPQPTGVNQGGPGTCTPVKKEMKVCLDGLGLYDIDMDFSSIAGKDSLPPTVDDSDYHSGSEGGYEARPHSVSSDVFEPSFSDREEGEEEEEEGTMSVTGVEAADRERKLHTCSCSSCDHGYDGDDEHDKTSSRKRQSTPSKGNHLWEFIRDLLKNPAFSPSLVRWEDRDMGVFKFVQSEAVAHLWGRKKNNPQMTYEKLSRAMRFCRSAGYFDSVPKTGRFPKKLCFRFGPKAHGWQD